LRRIGLHEALAAARLLELGSEPCKLGEVFVDDADFGRQVVVVDVLCEVSPGVAWDSVSASHARCGQTVGGDAPSPPIITTAGFAESEDMAAGAQVCAAGSLRRGSVEQLSPSLWVDSCFVIVIAK
jgi:hypothetical protein